MLTSVGRRSLDLLFILEDIKLLLKSDTYLDRLEQIGKEYGKNVGNEIAIGVLGDRLVVPGDILWIPDSVSEDLPFSCGNSMEPS
jgi:hypothetical protein